MSTSLPRPRRAGFASGALIAPLALLFAFGAVQDTAAQTPRQTPRLDAIARARESVFTPRSGPPGTVVQVRTINLPAITPVYLCIGGTRSGFEVLAPLLTTPQGEISESVTIPEWATWDRSHAFIVMDVYFQPLAMSELFYVTNAQGTLLRRGRMTDEGERCPAMRGEDGELYTLAGQTAGLEPGEEVAVEGTLAESSVCGQGTTLQVVRVQQAAD